MRMRRVILTTAALLILARGGAAAELGPGQSRADLDAQLRKIESQINALSAEIEKQRSAQQPQPQGPSPGREGEPRLGLFSYELPAVEVSGRREGEQLREEDLIGSYGQPRWTAQRRFAETRVYVIPEGEFEFEYWNIVEKPRHGDLEVTTKYEVEMGLPYRLQLDLYAIAHQQGNQGPMEFDEQDVEVRWALADWGVVPGNPTLYLEWKALDEAPDHVEGKLLFGGQPIPRLHWAANLVYKHEMGGAQEDSYEFTGAASYSALDEKFSIGPEVKVAYVNEERDRGFHDPEVLLGPSLQWRPLKRMHFDWAFLAGLNNDSPSFKSLLVLGWEF